MNEPSDQTVHAESDEVDSPPLGDGTDITAEGQDLESADTPATSDPDEMEGDGSLGGAGGPGGAG
jgi:hypothetical protein